MAGESSRDRQTKVAEVEASKAVAIREAELQMEVERKNALAEQLSKATVQDDTQAALGGSVGNLQRIRAFMPVQLRDQGVLDFDATDLPRQPQVDTTWQQDVVMDDGTVIHTTVTSFGDAVEAFLLEVGKQHGQHLLVGIDTEWRVVPTDNGRRGRGSYRMADLQLCVGHRCLVFQIDHADHVPGALKDFLTCLDHRFFGVSVDGDVKRLFEDCGLAVTRAVELRHLAAKVLNRPELQNAGLKVLARVVSPTPPSPSLALSSSNCYMDPPPVSNPNLERFICTYLYMSGVCISHALQKKWVPFLSWPRLATTSIYPFARWWDGRWERRACVYRF